MVKSILLTDIEQLTDILKKSCKKPQVLCECSVRCSVSGTAASTRMKSITSDADFYFTNVVNFRKISDKIAEYFDVCHDFLQVLLKKNNGCIHDYGYSEITKQELTDQIFLSSAN